MCAATMNGVSRSGVIALGDAVFSLPVLVFLPLSTPVLVFLPLSPYSSLRFAHRSLAALLLGLSPISVSPLPLPLPLVPVPVFPPPPDAPGSMISMPSMPISVIVSKLPLLSATLRHPLAVRLLPQPLEFPLQAVHRPLVHLPQRQPMRPGQ